MDINLRTSINEMVFKTKAILCLHYLFAYLLLLIGYYNFVVPIFGYTGFEWVPDYIKMFEGIFLTLMIPWVLPCEFRRPSDMLVHLQFLFPIVPMLMLYGAAGHPREYIYYSIVAFLLLVLIASLLPLKAIRVARLSPIVFERMLLTLAWGIICLIVLMGGLAYLNFDFSKVYEYRSEAAGNLPFIFNYISPPVSKVILPFALLLAVLNRNVFFALSALVGSIMMFGLTAHKGPIFYPLVVLSLYYLVRQKNPLLMLLAGYIIIICICLLDFALGGTWLGSLALRRVYLVPAYLNFLYYDFFSNNPFVLWAKSKFTFAFIPYDYDLDVSHLIGSIYFGSDLAGANTGWLGAGYMNAGFFGMLMAMLNAYAKSFTNAVVIAIIAGPMITIMLSSDLPTALLTHGTLLSLFFFTLLSIPRESDTKTSP